MNFAGPRSPMALAVVLSVAAVAGLQVRCAGQQAATESVVRTIQRRGALKVGISTFEPWAMRDRNGNLVGFEVDVATKVARDMGVSVEFVPTSWDGIIPALLAGKFDVIIGGLSIRPQRNLTINFTIPYAHSGMGIAASRTLAGDLPWPDGYDSEAVTLTCRRGATACNDVGRLFPAATVRRFDDDLQALQEVLNGNAHAIVSSYPKPVEWAGRNPELLFLPTTDNLSQGDEAFGLRQGDPDALNFFSNWIRVNTTSGWLQERYDYWFKSTNWLDEVRPGSASQP